MKSLVLAASAGDVPPAWLAFCAGAFGLDAKDAARLWRARPLVIPIAIEADRDRLAERLRRGGVPVEARDDPSRLPPCAEHARVAASEVCPRCRERRACVVCLHGEEGSLCPVCSGRLRLRARFRNVRVGLLLAILALVAWNTWASVRRVTSWKAPLVVGIYPVNGSPAVKSWTAGLDAADFQEIAAFLEKEAKRYGVATSPLVSVRVAKAVDLAPPPPPLDATPFAVMRWSLAFRWWDLKTRMGHGLPRATVKIWVVYHAPEDEKPLEHSLGLAKVHLGIVHAHAGERDAQWANLAIAHELLHTARATDKYTDGGKPLDWPEPERGLPQSRCEVMAGAIAIGADEWRPAKRLDDCLVGRKTAEEIGWLAAAARRAQ